MWLEFFCAADSVVVCVGRWALLCCVLQDIKNNGNDFVVPIAVIAFLPCGSLLQLLIIRHLRACS